MAEEKTINDSITEKLKLVTKAKANCEMCGVRITPHRHEIDLIGQMVKLFYECDCGHTFGVKYMVELK